MAACRREQLVWIIVMARSFVSTLATIGMTVIANVDPQRARHPRVRL